MNLKLKTNSNKKVWVTQRPSKRGRVEMPMIDSERLRRKSKSKIEAREYFETS